MTSSQLHTGPLRRDREDDYGQPYRLLRVGAFLILTFIPKCIYFESMNTRKLTWIASSKGDLNDMPEEVRRTFGFALYLAQIGQKDDGAKPLKGFGSAGVLEVVESAEGGTFRAVYTVRLKHAVYVLHCFQKKSTRGIKTSEQDIQLIKARLKMAEEIDRMSDGGR